MRCALMILMVALCWVRLVKKEHWHWRYSMVGERKRRDYRTLCARVERVVIDLSVRQVQLRTIVCQTLLTTSPTSADSDIIISSSFIASHHGQLAHLYLSQLVLQIGLKFGEEGLNRRELGTCVHVLIPNFSNSDHNHYHQTDQNLTNCSHSTASLRRWHS